MNQYMPIAANDAPDTGLEEDLVALARQLFMSQLVEVRTLAGELSVRPVSGDDALEIARLVHNIAGTATYFDLADLGRHAVAIEHQLRTAAFDEARQGACLALCEAIDRTAPA